MTPHAEITELHTGLMRLSLALEDSRAYFASVDPSMPLAARLNTAFEQRWFGPKSAARVTYLLRKFAFRYDQFPSALDALRRWTQMEPDARRLVCHWHVQLTDPLYRAFTGQYLVQRRAGPRPTIDYDTVVRWMNDQFASRWSVASCRQFASKLLSAAHEAGLVTTTLDPRPLVTPRVSNTALQYLLYLLRETHFEGSLLDNPYLASVGLMGPALEDRLSHLSSVHFSRMAQLKDLTWAFPDLRTWAEAVLT
ncbi:MAG: DUF1819 domain-containing protein [Myxococcales bacterium]|nr:DUF1819 domain-containing protein [Myxococcales bacterium]